MLNKIDKGEKYMFIKPNIESVNLNLINKIKSKEPREIFVALKLIEKLFKDGLIPDYMFRNILNDYADIVDISYFSTYSSQSVLKEDK